MPCCGSWARTNNLCRRGERALWRRLTSVVYSLGTWSWQAGVVHEGVGDEQCGSYLVCVWLVCVRPSSQIEHLGVSCTNKAPIYCEICFTENVPAGQAFGLGCGHVFCKECWSGYLSSAVNGACPVTSAAAAAPPLPAPALSLP